MGRTRELTVRTREDYAQVLRAVLMPRGGGQGKGMGGAEGGQHFGGESPPPWRMVHPLLPLQPLASNTCPWGRWCGLPRASRVGCSPCAVLSARLRRPVTESKARAAVHIALSAPCSWHASAVARDASQGAARGALWVLTRNLLVGGVQAEQLKRKLTRSILWAPLFDVAKWVADFDQLARVMWDAHVAGEPPRHLIPVRPRFS